MFSIQFIAGTPWSAVRCVHITPKWSENLNVQDKTINQKTPNEYGLAPIKEIIEYKEIKLNCTLECKSQLVLWLLNWLGKNLDGVLDNFGVLE